MGKPERNLLNQAFKDSKLIEEVKKKYRNSSPCTLDNYELVNKPFRLLKMNQLITDPTYLEQLIKDLREIEYAQKDNDLYSLHQSADLNGSSEESISQFIQLLRTRIEPFLVSVMDVNFNSTLSITASLYKGGDFLLCHDDKCDDRCVAFVFYLTGREDSGGHFNMFEHDSENGQPTVVTHSIAPEANSFICFEVGNHTYHEVSEVLDDNFERLSINGWFHSDHNRNLEGLNYTDPMPQLYPQVRMEKRVMIDYFINKTYCKPTNVKLAQGQFENDSFILISDFFKPAFYKACAKSLKESNLNWKTIGPANRRKYDCVDLQTLPDVFQKLIGFIKSPIFVWYVGELTGLNLVPISTNESIPLTQMTLEVQKWSQGSYTMATDNDAFFQEGGLDMMMYFNCDSFNRSEGNFGGSTTYLASATKYDEDSTSDDEEETELLTVEPQDNALILIYRMPDTVRVTKYVNHYNSGFFNVLSGTFFEP